MVHSASGPDDPLDEVGDSATDDESPPPSAPKTLLAEAFITRDDLFLVPTIRSVPDVTVQREGPAGAADAPLFVSAVGDSADAVDSALADDPTVAAATLFSASGDRRVYRLQPAPSATRFLPTAADNGVRILDVKSGDGGWVVRVQTLTRDELVEFRQACVEQDVTFEVRQLYDVDTADDPDDVRMTPRQRDTVLTAYQCGYYDVPRGISQGELAEKLEVSTSAISQQLRRATGQLIASTFTLNRD